MFSLHCHHPRVARALTLALIRVRIVTHPRYGGPARGRAHSRRERRARRGRGRDDTARAARQAVARGAGRQGALTRQEGRGPALPCRLSGRPWSRRALRKVPNLPPAHAVPPVPVADLGTARVSPGAGGGRAAGCAALSRGTGRGGRPRLRHGGGAASLLLCSARTWSADPILAGRRAERGRPATAIGPAPDARAVGPPEPADRRPAHPPRPGGARARAPGRPLRHLGARIALVV